jgi:CYTH domain-containing protein
MKEIERKFLVSDESFVAMATSHNRIAQGYLAARRVTARVRVYGDKAYITFKGKSKDGGLSRFEFEREIPVRCAELPLTRCSGTVEKLCYPVPYKGYTWEVDLFTGKNEGLVFGIGSKMFFVAGPVLVNGVAYSIVVGLIYYICMLF